MPYTDANRPKKKGPKSSSSNKEKVKGIAQTTAKRYAEIYSREDKEYNALASRGFTTRRKKNGSYYIVGTPTSADRG